MDETPKKLCNRKVKICRCCNSHLSNIYDSIDLFGKTAQRENVIEKLKEVGKIEVQESDQDFLTTKICRKCFRKVTGLAKAMDDFRNICSQSKEIQTSDLDNARLKRGRKPSTPTQEPHGKRRPTIPTEFTTRHFDTATLTPADPADQAAREECSSELRVQISSLFSCEQLPTNARDILPLLAVSGKNASSGDDEINKPQASEILMDAGLRNSQVSVKSYILFLRFKINGARQKKFPGKKELVVRFPKNLLRRYFHSSLDKPPLLMFQLCKLTCYHS